MGDLEHPANARLRVLRGHENRHTEVTEVLRGLCVEALKDRRTRRPPFLVAAIKPPCATLLPLPLAAGFFPAKKLEVRYKFLQYVQPAADNEAQHGEAWSDNQLSLCEVQLSL